MNTYLYTVQHPVILCCILNQMMGIKSVITFIMLLPFKLLAISIVLPCLLFVVHNITDRRIYDLERQDKSETEGGYTRAQYMELMHMLAETNMADPNGHNATLAAFARLTRSPESIMEIGFGLGHFSILLANKFPHSSVVGIDAHQLSVDSANTYLQSLPNPPTNFRFEGRRESELNEPPKSVDVITTTLVNHHIFPDEAFVEFLKRVAVVGRQAFIFNDMHRSLKCKLSNDASLLLMKHVGMSRLRSLLPYLPTYLTQAAARYAHVFTRPQEVIDLFTEGGMLSLRRSFSLSEYETMFARAGYPPGALQCQRLDKWHETLDATCRVVCVADLTWSG